MNTMIEEKRDYWVPLLKLMAELPNGKGRVAHIIKEFGQRYKQLIAPADMELQKNGSVTIWDNRVRWALTELRPLGYVNNPAHGKWEITQKARDWLAEHPQRTHLDEKPVRNPKQSVAARPRQAQSQPTSAAAVTLANLEQARQHMPPEIFRNTFGEEYDRLVAERRAQSITPVDRQKLLGAVMEHVKRIQDFVGGQGGARPSSEELCDWIHQCYLFGLFREVAVLWPLVVKEEVEPWYYERNKRIALACQSKSAFL